MDDPVRNMMSLLDENKMSLPENVYLEMCNNLKRMYVSGDTVRDNYILNLTNDYLSLLENNESLRIEITRMKRDLVRARLARFEDVSLPISNSRTFLENLVGASTQNPRELTNNDIPLPPIQFRF
jgi:hypothetical protein